MLYSKGWTTDLAAVLRVASFSKEVPFDDITVLSREHFTSTLKSGTARPNDVRNEVGGRCALTALDSWLERAETECELHALTL